MRSLKYRSFINGKRTYLYTKFMAMKSRCLNKNATDYHYYGERGITIEPYLLDFKNYVDYLYEILPVGKIINDMQTMKYSIDRINNDGNYERGNLRWVSQRDQIINRQIPKHNTSGFLGVGKRRNKWRARIQIDNKNINIGYYNSPEEAFDAYQKAYLTYNGHEAHAEMMERQRKHLEQK